MIRALLLLSLCFAGCSSTWQGKVRDVLRPTIPAVRIAKTLVARQQFCTAELQGCIAKRANPCAELLHCQARRRQLTRAFLAYETAVSAVEEALKATEGK